MTIKDFSFDDSRSAYDATQWDEAIKDGDLLVIHDEKIVGISGTWPYAITSESGELHAV